jgi:hypothetical protein
MRALVVYESMFGNTESVARAIGAGIAESAVAEVLSVQEIAPATVSSVDLLVLGGPTHAFSLSRPATRRDALAQGGTRGSADIGLREWIDRLTPAFLPGNIAVFDTRVHKVRRLPGSAARKATGLLRARGWPVGARSSFFVLDTPGPLMDGELDRAREWGRSLAERSTVPGESTHHGRPGPSARSW